MRVWYIATNPILRSNSLDYEAAVAIIQATDDMDDAQRMLDEFIAKGNAKPDQYTCCFRQMYPNSPLYVLTSTSAS